MLLFLEFCANLGYVLDGEWCKEAADTLHSLTHGVIMQAQVAGYSQDNLPEVLLFVSIAKDVSIFL